MNKETLKPATGQPPKAVCLVRGKQVLLVDKFVRETAKRFLGDSGSSELFVLYADETPVSEVINNVSNLSMFSSKKVVVLKRSETLDKQSVELIKKYAALPAPHACLILVSDDISKPELKTGESVFVKNFEESPRKIYEIAVDEAGKLGLTMGYDAAAHLCELIGDDLNVVRNEISKIVEIYGSGSRVNQDDIARMFERRKSKGVFELANAIVNREKTEALSILGEIAVENQIEPLVIFAAISSRVRNVLKAKSVVSKSSGVSAEQQKKLIARELKIKPGAAHFVWKQSRNFTLRNTNRIVENLADTDRALKTSRSNGYETLAKMTVSLLGTN